MTSVRKIKKLSKVLEPVIGYPIKKALENLEDEYKKAKSQKSRTVKDKEKKVKKVKKIEDKIEDKIEKLTLLKKAPKQKYKIKSFKEIDEIIYDVDKYDKLRRKRIINDEKEIMTQYPIASIAKSDKYKELLKNEDLMFVNMNFRKIIKQAHNELFKDSNIIHADIQLQVAYEVKIKNEKGITVRIEIGIIYSKAKDFKKDVDVWKMDLSPDLPDESDLRYIYIGYKIAFSAGNKKITQKTFRNLRAFKPSSDRKFHELTSGSTTDAKICIYESFLDILGIQKLKYMRDTEENRNITQQKLKDEGKEIEDSVRNGELINALELLTKKYENEIVIVFYNKYANNEIDFPILVSKGETEQFKTHNLRNHIGKEGMLYHKDVHVAPFIIKQLVSLDSKEKIINKTQKYKLRPETLIMKKEIDEEIKKRKVKNILGFDTETYLDEAHKCTVFNLTIYGKLHGEKISKSWYGNNDNEILNNFIDYINEICTKVDNKKSRPNEAIEPIFIYGFNNSRFDNLFIYEKLYEEDPETEFIFTTNAIKKIQYNNIHIYDLNLFYTGSLKKVAKDFGLNISKSPYPYKFPNKDNLDYIGEIPGVEYFNKSKHYEKCKELCPDGIFNLKDYTEKYCLLDSQLVYLIAIKHIDESIGFINGKLYDSQKCGTGASVAKKCFVQLFLDDILEQSPDKIIEHERMSYKGGRTEVFKKFFDGDTHKRLYYYDINSSYPSSMTREMPFEYLKTMSLFDTIAKEKDIVLHNNYLAKIEYNRNDKNFIPNVLFRVEEGDILACKNSDFAYHWGCELVEAIKNKCTVTLKSCDFYKPKAIFKEFAEHYYNERLEAKTTNPAKASFKKTVLVSLYGKFGQRVFTKKKMVRNSSEMYETLGEKGKLIYQNDMNNYMLVEYKTEDDECKSIGKLVRFSSYITALSRCKLSEAMRNIGHEHIYYCDTDSIFTDKRLNNKYVDRNKLGFWKEEEANGILMAIFLAPKSYYYITCDGEEKNKCKGVDKKKMKKEDYENLLNGKVNTIAQSRDMFFRSFGGIKIENMVRSINTVYNKRIWNDNESMSFDNVEQWRRAKEEAI
jgi:hypothetical protein